MRVFPSFVPLMIAGAWTLATGSSMLHGQQSLPAFASNEAFSAALSNVDWENSYNTSPRLRFLPEKIEMLANDGKVTGTYTAISMVEPGIVKAEHRSGDITLHVFGDDLRTFVKGSMKDMSEFEVRGATGPVKLPATAADKPLEIVFKNNPFWKGLRIHADKVEILDEKGNAFATNPGIRFYPHVMGVELPEKRAGMILLSRQRPGGWYVDGRFLGTGVRTEDSNVFRPFLASKLTNFAHRSAHFVYPLLIAKQPELAAAQEKYALYNAANAYGETSEQMLYALNEIGKLHGYARSYDGAARVHARAYAHAKANFGQDKAKLLETGTDLAEAQAEMGDFAAAKVTLAEVFPHLPPDGGDARIPYAFYKALASAEFGLRNYPQAAKLFTENYKRATDGQLNYFAIESMLDLTACQMAQNQPLEAAASLRLAMERQDAWAQKNPRSDFDTYRLSFACVAMKKWDEAMKYSSLTNRRSSVAYEEYARLTALLNQGKKAEAQKLAKQFAQRFKGGLDEVNIRRDIDAMTVQLTAAAADQTPAATAELERVWAQQVESLRKRPLQNYLFARVMVDAIQALKK